MSMVLGKVTSPVLGAHASLPVLGQVADVHPVVGEVFLVLGALANIPLDTADNWTSVLPIRGLCGSLTRCAARPGERSRLSQLPNFGPMPK